VADVVYRLEVPEGRLAEDAYLAVVALIEKEKPAAVFAQPSSRVQLLVGRATARLRTNAIPNVIGLDCIDEPNTMYFGGLAHRKYKAKGAGTLFYFMRPGIFPNVEASGQNKEEKIAFIEPSYKARINRIDQRQKSAVCLPQARRIVSVGRGVREEKDLEQIRELCQLLGAELACSRSIYESEAWLPKEALVGISGNTVAPNLYLSLGISGQAQHMVACDASSTIACVNTDPHALIFDHADYGSTASLYEVVPRMITYFKEHPLQ
jgi:electron transfer flavoprotein alpha subunit